MFEIIVTIVRHADKSTGEPGYTKLYRAEFDEDPSQLVKRLGLDDSCTNFEVLSADN